MKNLAFSTGQYRVDAPGAALIMAHSLLFEKPENLSGAIIGAGTFTGSGSVSKDFQQIDISSEHQRKIALLRQLSRINRFNDYRNPRPVIAKIMQGIDNKINEIADRIAARHLEILLKNHADIKVVVGLAGLSTNVGRTAKKYGLKFGVHSQFCHPNFQNRQLEDAYRGLNLVPPAVSKRKLECQLATFEMADFIWCPSEFAYESHISNGTPAKKLFTNYYGIPVKDFLLPIPAGETNPDGVFTVLFVGNVGVQKGIHVLLEAAELSNIGQMEIIFNGAADPYAKIIIEDYRKRFGNRKIRISVDPGDPRRHYEKSSVCILPSVHDSFGISILEAMVAGLPVIVSDHVGAKKIVKPGENGFMFPSGNAAELAKHIEFFHDNPEKIPEFGRNAIETGKDFDYSRQGKALEMNISQYLT